MKVGFHWVLGMKSMANGILLKSNTVTPIECLQYALNLPPSVVITGIDSMKILDQAFAAVESFHPLSNYERETLLAKTREAEANGHFEPFKTSSILLTAASLSPSAAFHPCRRRADLDQLPRRKSCRPRQQSESPALLG